MDKDSSIRAPADAPPPDPAPLAHDTEDQPTCCGLTRKELRTIVEEIIG